MSRSSLAAIAIAILSSLVVCPAIAADPDKCDPALVVATYDKFQTSHLDWRMATLVTEAEWNQVSHSAGANAVIYGVPVGASYSDFQSRASQKLDSQQQSLTRDEFLNIAWTGLDNNSTNAYAQCLNTELFSQDGLHMAVKRATETDVSIIVAWRPVHSDPRKFTPNWNWDGPGKDKLPHSIVAGQTVVVVPRPNKQQQLAIDFNGAGDSVVVEPVQVVAAAPAPSPNAPLVVRGVPIVIDFKDKNPGQYSGCSCGDLAITFPGDPFSAAVMEPFRFRYDGSSMCHGQGFDRFHGTISWDGNQSTTMANANSGPWPGIAGTVVTTFSKAGDYNVAAYISVDCLHTTCRNTCTANGVAHVHISDH